ncbi:MAG: gamma-glutamyl-gamma-aminobutyrate hydrolase family protein [Myxococcota bacterium]|nr:gamma-glutamyl-gamma-aminobutyrate hydrolase family protein [Myxococcota bacterium]
MIGIPLSLDDRERWRAGRRYLYLDELYPQAVEQAGGLPALIPLHGDPTAWADRIDALLIPGGDDFLPSTPYPKSVSFTPTPESQLRFDRALLKAALRRKLPVLGVCYGAQLLALHHSGQLHHHIPTDLPGASTHQLPEAEGRHALQIEPRSRLSEVVGTLTTSVNSLHHQAIADPGPGMRVSARAPDGVIEAIESVDHRFVLGVQWHPERLPGVVAGQGLIEALVSATRRG